MASSLCEQCLDSGPDFSSTAVLNSTTNSLAPFLVHAKAAAIHKFLVTIELIFPERSRLQSNGAATSTIQNPQNSIPQGTSTHVRT